MSPTLANELVNSESDVGQQASRRVQRAEKNLGHLVPQTLIVMSPSRLFHPRISGAGGGTVSFGGGGLVNGNTVLANKLVNGDSDVGQQASQRRFRCWPTS